MPRNSKPPRSASVPPCLPPAQSAYLLNIQCEKGKALLANRPITSAGERAWETVTHDVLLRAFGFESPNVGGVMDIGKYDFAFGGGNEQEWEQQRAKNMETRLRVLEQLIELLHSTEELSKPGTAGSSAPGAPDQSNRVFLVHGHHEATIHETARWLERFGLRITILREQPDVGRTLIEKFVHFSDVAFAVVLLTSDDRGGALNAPYERQEPRARQNVILELGFFLGKLGRKRVCALHQPSVEIPSDYSGVLFVPLDEGGAWRLTLARELKAAGLDIDMNKAV